MSDFNTLARPYAEALFEMAAAGAVTSAWDDALQALASWVDNADARSFLADPERSDADKVHLLRGIDVAVDGEAWGRFVELLIRNDRWLLAREIANLFRDALRRAKGELDVLVTSAFALDDAQKAAVVAAMERRHPGMRITLREEIDPELLGGLLIQAGDESIDASVRGQLQQLAQNLRN
ncbi:F0F1 ATP synthase subunit delta [Candidatus Igneacidithiobacillus taiwanensis]|uniref:F0F1 ATP synthase subunit delta n=1 Tax=Candidatus Igneacidithiobacillus taiwanensis TaxID=1945924 RepID=UPI00289C79E8|nr:F0F1 ATP synthase subunit delta [Candidatus Igneacidithiobacillus taiwanensis]MCE5359652.1 F0F1 ATP synthase subunit delta [Acidithiobacillus sp.]